MTTPMTNASTPTSSARDPEVFEPSFVEALEDLSMGEVRRRRDEALAEREFQSYLRRILQVRQDIFQAEQERRRSGADPGRLVDRLTRVLAEGPRGSSRGEALRFSLSSAQMEEADRKVQAILGPVAEVPVQDVEEAQLTEALRAITQEERAVSTARMAVFRVHDRLQAELKRRFRDDPSQVQPLL
jgi:RsiG-like